MPATPPTNPPKPDPKLGRQAPAPATSAPSTFKLGRRPPVARQRAFRLGDYLKRTLPIPPTTGDWSQAALPCLTDILGNDQLGDCTSAGAAHVEGIFRANAGNGARMPILSDTIRFYSETTGYVPGDPSTDQGGDEQTVLRLWQEKGFFDDGTGKIYGWLSVDGTEPVETAAAIFLFENLYFGVSLPDEWISPFPSANGFIWDVVGEPDINNGHAFIASGWKPGFKKIWTWGLWGWITDAAIAKYATTPGTAELYTILSQDSISKATGRAPNGFDWSQLQADLEGLK